MSYLNKVEASNVLLSILWVVFSIPLYLALSNALAPEVQENIDDNKAKDIQSIVPAIEFDSMDFTGNYDESEFIWEDRNTFDDAFRIARTYLGPDNVFIWNDKHYHTNFAEEMNLLTTREQEFSQTLNGEKESK
tara:strand:+ start:1158 stop:1559 length:402 start_codon:yes stop_codon:yes gene_type:complete